MKKLILILIVLILSNCRTPVESGTPCNRCGVLTIPPPDQVEEAMHLGWYQASLTCPTLGPYASYRKPAIDWKSCDFLARNESVCAAGATYASDGFIRISTAIPSNTLALVTWESRNWYWTFGGCENQTVARYYPKDTK